jgi:hypothetical protein
MPLVRPRAFRVPHHRVVQHIAHLFFAAHQLDVVVIPRKLGVQCLDRGDPARDLVARPVDFTRSAPAQNPLDLVGMVQDLALAEDVSGQGADHPVISVCSPGPVFKTGTAKTFAMRKFPD